MTSPPYAAAAVGRRPGRPGPQTAAAPRESASSSSSSCTAPLPSASSACPRGGGASFPSLCSSPSAAGIAVAMASAAEPALVARLAAHGVQRVRLLPEKHAGFPHAESPTFAGAAAVAGVALVVVLVMVMVMVGLRWTAGGLLGKSPSRAVAPVANGRGSQAYRFLLLPPSGAGRGSHSTVGPRGGVLPQPLLLPQHIFLFLVSHEHVRRRRSDTAVLPSASGTVSAATCIPRVGIEIGEPQGVLLKAVSVLLEHRAAVLGRLEPPRVGTPPLGYRRWGRRRRSWDWGIQDIIVAVVVVVVIVTQAAGETWRTPAVGVATTVWAGILFELLRLLVISVPSCCCCCCSSLCCCCSR